MKRLLYPGSTGAVPQAWKPSTEIAAEKVIISHAYSSSFFCCSVRLLPVSGINLIPLPNHIPTTLLACERISGVER